MQKICFHYKGSMIKVTNTYKEVFEYNTPISTVREALDVLNEYYDYKLNQYVSSNVNVILKIDENKSLLLTTEEDLDTKLSHTNTIIFYYPFKGG